MGKVEEEKGEWVIIFSLGVPKLALTRIDFCPIWCIVGDAFFNEQDAPELECPLCWLKRTLGEGYLVMPI